MNQNIMESFDVGKRSACKAMTPEMSPQIPDKKHNSKRLPHYSGGEPNPTDI
ncbi:MAG: hypothetical protein AAGC73_03505 [Verrucomicrobiota bacterium]